MKRRDFMVAFRDVGGPPNLLPVADEVIEWWRCLLLHCMSPFMALVGLGPLSDVSP
jgi:hypothetical protein